MECASAPGLLATIKLNDTEKGTAAAQRLLQLLVSQDTAQDATEQVQAGQAVLLRAMASADEDLVEACGAVLAHLSRLQESPPERTRAICLPHGPTLHVRELADFEGDKHGAQVVRFPLA
mmetsp:Transcript_31467/g.80666  ORF Transcript_31467/g.80666 Transcript_31467/m.80666 type:complete len:120 (+) Transcript_31467:186-545(+)